MKRALCPGTFDPVTHGHLDIVTRAARLFDEVIVGVGTNSTKNPLFGLDDRLRLVRSVTAELPNVTAMPIDGLLVDFCREHDCMAVVKGLRFASDFDYELQMAQLNKQLSGIETIMLPTAAEWSFVSSTMMREIARLGGDISAFVPPVVADSIHTAVAARQKEDR